MLIPGDTMADVPSWRRARVAALAVTACLVLPPLLVEAIPQQPPPVPSAMPSASPAADEAAFAALVRQFYDGVARKDIAAVEGTWHTQAPARAQRNILVMGFELRDETPAAITLSRISADAGGGRVRAVVDVRVRTIRTGHTRQQRRVRDLTFLPEGGAWKIWNDASAGPELARRLLAVSGGEREALLAAEPELVSDEALEGLTREIGILRNQGMSPGLLDVLTLQQRLARAVGNTAVRARSLLDTGLIHQISGEHEIASPAFAEAREAFLEVGDAEQVAACDANLGNIEYLLRNYQKAFDHYQRALGEYEALKDAPRAASVRHSLGNVHYVLGDFERAIEAYQQSLEVFDRTSDTYAAARVVQALGQVHKELGNYATALGLWRRHVDLSLAIRDTTGAAAAWRSMGDIERLQGDYARALGHFTQSLALWDTTPDVANRATTRFAIGQTYAGQRSFARAIDWYQQALALDEKAALDAAVARDLGGLAGAHLALDQPDKALDEYLRSLALREKTNDTAGIMWTLAHIGVLHALEDRHADALAAWQRSLEMAEAARDAAAIGTITALRARSLLESGEADAGLAAAQRAIEIAAAAEDFDVVSHAHVTVGRVHRLGGRIGEAIGAFERAVAAVERVPIEPGAETFFNDRRSPYLAMVDLLVAETRGADAFLWAERLRQRALADLLGADGLIVTKGLPTAARDEERRLLREGRAAAVRLRRERAREHPDAARLADVRAEVVRVQAAREAAREAAYAAQPTLRALRGRRPPRGLEDAAAALHDEVSALLSFVVSEKRTWVFVVARDAQSGAPALRQVATIETKAEDLAGTVEAFARAVATNADGVSEASRALRALLIDPVGPGLAGLSRLIVVPDAFLWGVPFEALQDQSGRFLIEDTSVSYAVSASALATMTEVAPPAPPRRFIVAAGSPQLHAAAEARLALLRPPSAKPADGAAREVRAVAALAGPAASRVLVGGQARVADVREQAATASILHLAAPAMISGASPLFSVIALTPAGADDRSEGLVEVADLVDWTLPLDAAVLSRAETGAGILSGDGVGGLHWALFVAGTPALVVNRWTLADATAADLVVGLYRLRLATVAGRPGGRTWAEALQRAATRLLAQPATRHPYYWAGLLVLGR